MPIKGKLSHNDSVVPNDLMNTPEREWVGLQREGKSEKEIMGQEKRVKPEGKKNDFGFVFESQ